MRDGVLVVDRPGERAEVEAERSGVVATERNAALGGINDAFDDLARADGALREAILALPDGDDSHYYREPGYFLNVKNSLRGFRFITERLQVHAGERLLDIGADLTWSTNSFARRGLRCTALDVNHHLAVGAVFQARYGATYDMVRADMQAPVFRPEAFDVIVAFNALHHGGDLDGLAMNLARMLAPGGRIGAVEPYCVDAAQKAQFGLAQIESGINEHTYLLDEWHGAFVRAGLALEEVMVADACNMIYRKSSADRPMPAQSTMLERAYPGALVAVPSSVEARAGSTVQLDLQITNGGNATWCSDGALPVRASYHLSRREQDGTSLVTFDGRRTAIPDIRPGATERCAVLVDAPPEPGEYVVTIDLVQEGLCWFAQRGFHGAAIDLRVVA
jgi:SAM-dependent methyltransferase